MQQGLKTLLTQEVTPDGHPLFTNAAKLGEAIVRMADDHYQNPKTTAALISFVFRGERPCSEGLRSAILSAARSRLKKQPKRVQDDWMQAIGRAIDQQNADAANAQEQQSENDEEQFGELLQREKTADDHFIITPLTAEQEKGVKRAEELNKILMERLGISPSNSGAPTTVYRFLLPGPVTAQKFWEKLRDKAALAHSGNAWIKERLEWLDTHNYLQVYVVPPFVCGCPIVVYDPDTTRDAAAFSFSHHHQNIIDTIRWDAVSVRQWTENVFAAFKPCENEEAAAALRAQHPSKFGPVPLWFCGTRYRFTEFISSAPAL